MNQIHTENKMQINTEAAASLGSSGQVVYNSQLCPVGLKMQLKV